jgi:HD superfamily phosphohydrolase
MGEKQLKEEEEEIISLPRLKFPKTVMDPIHKCIQLTQLEHDLLQLPSLNRLHNIHQLGLAYLVYPAAKTSRFEHSLGVMSIASKMIYQILESATYEELKEVFSLDPSCKNFAKECRDLIQKVRLAALLHDVGHGPFSHVSELILREALEPDEIKEAMMLFNCNNERDIPVHEYFSYKMITSENSDIKNTIERYGINAGDVADLLIKKETEKEGIRLLRKIISSQLDADRLDNLLRDSHATGVPFGLSDIDRVISNLFISGYKGKYEIVVHERALRGVEDIIDSRFKMYKSVYAHHMICGLEKLLRTAIESMIKENFEGLKYEDFRPERFLNGEVDDIFIFSKLKKYQKNHPEYKGFFDRRYAPISLIKRKGDLDYFTILIRGKMGIGLGSDVISARFRNWLKALDEGNVTIEPRNDNLKNIVLLPSTKPFSPYKELIPELILVGKRGSEMPSDILVKSSYVSAINNDFKEEVDQSLRISFLIPGIQRKAAKQYQDEVSNWIAEEVAKFA